MGTLKPPSNGQYSNTVIGTLAANALLHLVPRGGALGGLRPRPGPLLAVPTVTAHPSTASVQTSYYSMWHNNCLRTLKGQPLTKQNFFWKLALNRTPESWPYQTVQLGSVSPRHISRHRNAIDRTFLERSLLQVVLTVLLSFQNTVNSQWQRFLDLEDGTMTLNYVFFFNSSQFNSSDSYF